MSNRKKLRKERPDLPPPSAAADYIATEQLDMMARGGGRVNLGRTVVCDAACAQDWTNRPESGGIIHRTWAVCPDCAPRFTEPEHIRARCPEGMSFADFVRRYRGGDLIIEVAGKLDLESPPSGRSVITYQDMREGEWEGATFTEPGE